MAFQLVEKHKKNDEKSEDGRRINIYTGRPFSHKLLSRGVLLINYECIRYRTGHQHWGSLHCRTPVMQANTGEIPLLFRLRSAVVPCIGFVKVARLGERLTSPPKDGGQLRVSISRTNVNLFVQEETLKVGNRISTKTETNSETKAYRSFSCYVIAAMLEDDKKRFLINLCF